MKLCTIYVHYCFIIVPTLIDVHSLMLQLSLSATSPALWLEYTGGILVNSAWLTNLKEGCFTPSNDVKILIRE